MVSKELETAVLQLIASTTPHTNSSSIVDNYRLRDLASAFWACKMENEAKIDEKNN